MKKIKKVWEENKVLLVLAIILVICIVVVVVVSITYFYGSSESVYGNRLDITEEVPLKEELLSNIEEELTKDESVKSVSTVLKGRIVYININFVDGTKMEDAKKKTSAVLDLFSEEELAVYDINFTINTLSTEKVVGYTLMGARNSGGSGDIIWNNYNLTEESAEK